MARDVVHGVRYRDTFIGRSRFRIVFVGILVREKQKYAIGLLCSHMTRRSQWEFRCRFLATDNADAGFLLKGPFNAFALKITKEIVDDSVDAVQKTLSDAIVNYIGTEKHLKL